ncbi:MAG: hypothetical protein AB7W47_16005 [Calditrichaceae bacterium]
MKIQIIAPLLFFIIAFTDAAEKIQFQLGAEAGGYRSEYVDGRFVSRIFGRFDYQNQFNNNYVQLKARVFPERYGFENSVNALKFSGDLTFGKSHETFNWQLRLYDKRYFYFSDIFDNISFDVFLLGGQISKFVSPLTVLRLALDYTYRDLSEQPRNRLDSFTSALALSHRIQRNSLISFVIGAENYEIQFDSIEPEPARNNGWRIGPGISYHHKSVYLFDFSYQFILESSDLSEESSREHQIKILWGRFLSKKWSLFLYGDYRYFSDKVKDIPADLSYTPVNNENWYYIKLGYDIDIKREIYLKTGYSKEDLIYSSRSLSGWQGLLGFNLAL